MSSYSQLNVFVFNQITIPYWTQYSKCGPADGRARCFCRKTDLDRSCPLPMWWQQVLIATANPYHYYTSDESSYRSGFHSMSIPCSLVDASVHSQTLLLFLLSSLQRLWSVYFRPAVYSTCNYAVSKNSHFCLGITWYNLLPLCDQKTLKNWPLNKKRQGKSIMSASATQGSLPDESGQSCW